MNGDFTLTVTTPRDSHETVVTHLRDSNGVMTGINMPFFGCHLLENLRAKMEFHSDETDFFVIINYVCREYGLRFISHKENVSAYYRHKKALLEKK
jgi:hypothetical protein